MSCENENNLEDNMNYKIWASQCINRAKLEDCSSDIENLVNSIPAEKFNSLYYAIIKQKVIGDVYIVSYVEEGEVYVEKLLMICSANNMFSSYSIVHELGELKVTKVDKKMDSVTHKLIKDLQQVFTNQDSDFDKYPFPNLITRVNENGVDIRINCTAD